MAKQTTTYISNPFSMIGPSANALGTNITTLIKLLGLMLSPILIALVAGIIGIAGKGSTVAEIIAVFLGLVTVVCFIGLILLALPTYTIILLASGENKKVTLKDSLTQARPFIWRSLGLSLLTALAVLGGIILFVVPGIIFAIWFILGQYALVNENLGVVASMKRSRELVRGRFWEMWSLSLLPTLAYVVPFIGGLLNFVLSVILIPAMAIRYQQLVATKQDRRPAIHWSNYAVCAALAVAAVAAIGFAAANFDNFKTDIKNDFNNSTYYETY